MAMQNEPLSPLKDPRDPGTDRETILVRGWARMASCGPGFPDQVFLGDHLMTSFSSSPRELAGPPDLLTVEELCRWLKVPKATVYDWTHTGVIPHYKVGRLVRFDPHEIEAWLEARRIRGRRTRVPRPAPRTVSQLPAG